MFTTLILDKGIESLEQNQIFKPSLELDISNLDYLI